MKKRYDIYSLILIIVFTYILITPALIQFSGFNRKGKNFENRILAAKPKWSAMAFQRGFFPDAYHYLQDFTGYFNDHFGFRNEYFTIHRDIKMKCFLVSPNPKLIVMSRSGWFYLADSVGGNDILESKAIEVFNKRDLLANADAVSRFGSFVAGKGIKLYFSIAPNKLSVYGKKLPIVKVNRPTKLEQFKAEMARRNFEVIDLKEKFSSMPNVRLFYKTDSHWNGIGAFLGYLSLMERIKKDFPEVQVLGFQDFKQTDVCKRSSDLTDMLNLPANEVVPTLLPLVESEVIGVKDQLPVPEYFPYDPDSYEQRFVCREKPLKVLVFGDSFFIWVLPYFNKSFGETVYVWEKWNRSVIEIEKPDLVLCETVERHLDDFMYQP